MSLVDNIENVFDYFHPCVTSIFFFNFNSYNTCKAFIKLDLFI